MRKMKKAMAAAIGTAMALASIGSAQASAVSLSSSASERASTEAGDSNELLGNTFALGLAILVVLAITVVVVEQSDSP